MRGPCWQQSDSDSPLIGLSSWHSFSAPILHPSRELTVAEMKASIVYEVMPLCSTFASLSSRSYACKLRASPPSHAE